MLVSVLLLGVVGMVLGQHDDTLVPEARGADVVEKVEEMLAGSCTFPDDKLFGRRLAYIESSDGLHPDTYRTGYHGGIWQVDESMFAQTQSASGLDEYTDAVKENFEITWSRVTWEDLRKPLYSGIAARLYYLSQAGSTDVPRDIPAQAQFWQKYYRPGGDVNYFETAANQLEKGCSSTAGVDMVFVIDGSGSIGSANFIKIKDFIAGVVEAFDVAPDKTQVGLILYSTAVTNEFYLNTHGSQADVLQAVHGLRYQGGGTNTHAALDALVRDQFTASSGARAATSGVPRVAIVLTDGVSNDPAQTVLAALRAHDQDITMFAIGIGSTLDLNELEVIASAPTCLHLFLLKDFSEVEALKYAIEKRTCDAPVIIGPGNNGTDIGGSIPPGGDQNCKLRLPEGGATVKVRVQAGQASFYTASDTYPSEAYYEHKVSASPGRAGVLYIPQPSTPDAEALIFCNIKGDEDEESDLDIGITPGPDEDLCRCDPCQNGGSCIDEGDTYRCDCPPDFTGQDCSNVLDPCVSNPCRMGSCNNDGAGGYTCACMPGFTGPNCDTDVDHCSPNPCQFGDCCSGREGYTCFCKSGYTGKNCDTEINPCKPNPCAHGDCRQTTGGFSCECDAGWTGDNCDQEVDPCKPNPCAHGDCRGTESGHACECDAGWTGANCDEEEVDPCKPNPCAHGDCRGTESGHACECDAGWTGDNCDEEESGGGYDCGSRNPCSPSVIVPGRFYYPHRDSAKYVQCSEWGQCYEMDCPPGLSWNDDAFTCTP